MGGLPFYPTDLKNAEMCGICGYTFKPGDICHEVELGVHLETVCDMCYHNVVRRE